MTTGDRISELYKGLASDSFSEETRSIDRQRIHWICRRAEGRKIIDIGCSQGIASILLAREGFEVTGVDTSTEGIEYANADRANEAPEVQQKLTFIRGDVCDIDLPDREFDTAIMGEFLEHLVQPDRAIERAYKLLADDGKLIITVPFGLYESPDHKQTFYTARLYKLIHPYFVITEVEVIGKHLCVVCKRREAVLATEPSTIDLFLVERAEQALYQIEVSLTRERDAKKKEAARFRAEWRARIEDLTRMRAELIEQRAVRASLSFQLGSLLVQGIVRPGRNTILLPYRAFRLGMRAFRKRASSSTPRTAGKKAYVLGIIEGRTDEIKVEERNARARAAGPRREDLRIAVIMDEIFYELFKYEARLIAFTPEDWPRVLRKNKPDLLLIDSAWRGNNGSWRYQIVNLKQKPDSRLPDLVAWCRGQNIPTAFWNREDPLHYEEFVDAARLFDYVFTTDADCIERYKKDLGHNNVFCLPFAAQPRIHNPIGSRRKMRDVGFAGSWHAAGHDDRVKQMEYVLKPALEYDVDIFDRFHSMNDERYRFPEQYQPSIVGGLPYDEMVYAYKMYRLFLNINSIPESPTMFAMRVPEILASGTCVLSARSKGIENVIGSDIVKMTSSAEETRSYLDLLLGNKELRDRLAHLGLRKVMTEHTYEQRLDYLLDAVGIRKRAQASREKGVSIIACTNKLGFRENIFANYDRQQVNDKELIVILNNNKLDMEEWVEEAGKHKNVSVYKVDEKEGLGTCLNLGVDKTRFGYIAKFDDDDYYGPAYLGDAVLAFEYSNADIIGKNTYYIYFEKDSTLAIRFPDKEQRFTTFVSGATMVIKRGVFEKVRFDSQKGPGSDTRFQERCLRKGLRIYSADRFNFALVRKPSTALHTWQAADEELLPAAEVVCHTEDCRADVTC